MQSLEAALNARYRIRGLAMKTLRLLAFCLKFSQGDGMAVVDQGVDLLTKVLLCAPSFREGCCDGFSHQLVLLHQSGLLLNLAGTLNSASKGNGLSTT